jgi:hypothetical protein
MCCLLKAAIVQHDMTRKKLQNAIKKIQIGSPLQHEVNLITKV